MVMSYAVVQNELSSAFQPLFQLLLDISLLSANSTIISALQIFNPSNRLQTTEILNHLYLTPVCLSQR